MNENQDADTIEPIETQVPAVSDADINEARSLGWAPREKWRGRQEDFVEAPEFLRRAREHLPVVKSLFEKEKAERAREKAAFEAERKKEQAAYNARVSDFEKRLNAQAKMHERNMELQRVALVEKFDEEKRQALMIEDPRERQQAYDQANKRERAAIERVARVEAPAAEDYPQARQTAPAEQQAPLPPPQEVVDWSNRNPWFTMNPFMRDDAIRIMGEIEAGDPSLPLHDRLDRVTETVKERYPAWFPAAAPTPRAAPEPRPAPAPAAAPQPPKHQSVESGGPVRTAPPSKAKGFKDLPGEAKVAFADLHRRHIYGKPKTGEDEEKHLARAQKLYADTYWEEYGE